MNSIADKETFVKKDAAAILSNAPIDAKANWGKMNLLQTIDHLSEFFNVSAAKTVFPIVTPVEQLPLFKNFLLSDKMFRENTKAPANIIPEEPTPSKHNDLPSAIENLKEAIQNFENHFSSDKTKTTAHPVFGELNYEEWIQLHYKHLHHHLKQFGLIA